jgi:PAS domain S-box-containing protein
VVRKEVVYDTEKGKRYTYNIVVPVRDAERSYGIAGVNIDITETKQMEARLRALLRAIPDFMARISRDGTYLEALHGADFDHLMNSDQMIGKSIYDILPLDAAALRMEYIHRALETGELQTYEYAAPALNGEMIDLEARITVTEPDEVLVMVRNITARKESEARAFDLGLERERIALLRRFVGDRTHDLMTPLTIIKTSLYLLGKANSAQRRDEQITKLGTQIDNLEAMIRNMLMILQLDKPIEDEFEFVLQDVNALIDRIVADHQPVAISRQQILQHDGQASLPLVQVDSEKLERALANLIDNALKYTAQGGKVVLTTGIVNNAVCISVRDNGRGIPGQDLPHIFDRFYRSEHSQSTAGGSGLGLAIVDKIVRAHGGYVEADSAPEQGSTFRVFLPLTTPAAEEIG